MGLATAIVGGALVSGYASKRASERASGSAEAATAMAVEENARQFDITRSDLAPFREAGQAAVRRLSDVLGLGTGGASVAGEILTASPGFQFRLDQATKALERNQSRFRFTPRAAKELTRFSQDFASNEFGNFLESQFRLAGLGGNALNTSAAAGATAAGNIGNARMNLANVQGNAAIAGASGINNAVQGGLQNFITLSQYNNLLNRLSPQPTPVQLSGPF